MFDSAIPQHIIDTAHLFQDKVLQILNMPLIINEMEITTSTRDMIFLYYDTIITHYGRSRITTELLSFIIVSFGDRFACPRLEVAVTKEYGVSFLPALMEFTK